MRSNVREKIGPIRSPRRRDQQGRRHGEAKRSRCLQIDRELELGRDSSSGKGVRIGRPAIFKMNDCHLAGTRSRG